MRTLSLPISPLLSVLLNLPLPLALLCSFQVVLDADVERTLLLAEAAALQESPDADGSRLAGEGPLSRTQQNPPCH
jgi:hypothetical protein